MLYIIGLGIYYAKTQKQLSMKTKEFDNIVARIELGHFMNECHKAGQLTKEQSDKIELLWNEYKLTVPEVGNCLVTADFGILGSIVIREIKELDDYMNDGKIELKYKSGSYDYISIKSNGTKRILWTDYSNVEPYNRQSGLYCDGISFEQLGPAVIEKPEYREFQSFDNHQSNISFGIWGYDWNSFYGSIRFGICIKSELLNEFISKIRAIVNK